jgi:hypothetical protein
MSARRVVARAWLALAPSLAGCAAATAPGGSTEPAERDKRDIAAIHVSKCGACHTSPDPKTRTRGYLEDALSRHRKRVRLTSDEWAEMTDYLAKPEGRTARQP